MIVLVLWLDTARRPFSLTSARTGSSTSTPSTSQTTSPENHIPEDVVQPYDVEIRINEDGNLPQIQFSEEGAWHYFAPNGGRSEGRVMVPLPCSNSYRLYSGTPDQPPGKALPARPSATATEQEASAASRR